MPRRVAVSDHAVLRVIERVYGIDVDAIRHQIIDLTTAAARAGANKVIADGVHYVISHRPEENLSVITTAIVPEKWSQVVPGSARGKR